MPKDEKPPRNGDADKPASADLQEVKAYYDLMVAEGLSYLEIKNEDVHIALSREAPAAFHPVAISAQSQHAPVPAAVAAPADRPSSNGKKNTIDTPLAGVFYRAASPTGSAFVKEGDTVEPGQTLCIVEAMKVMNEIKAEARARIVRIEVENARPVAAGQALFAVEPA